MDIRIGQGIDYHQLVEGRKLIIGGVEVPHTKGALGHSDADVLLHSICDAMLGALSLGDIGKHYPDTDPDYKDADSKILLQDTYKMIEQRGYIIGNIDSTLMLQKPKIASYIMPMRECIAELLKIEIERISVKATTTEKLDAVGAEKGIVAQAVCLLIKK